MAPLGALQCRAPSGVPIVPLIVLQTGLKIFQGHEQHAEHLAAGASHDAEMNPDCRSADVRRHCLGACCDHSNHDGKSGDLAGGSFGKNRRHYRMDQQGRLCPPRDGANWDVTLPLEKTGCHCRKLNQAGNDVESGDALG